MLTNSPSPNRRQSLFLAVLALLVAMLAGQAVLRIGSRDQRGERFVYQELTCPTRHLPRLESQRLEPAAAVQGFERNPFAYASPRPTPRPPAPALIRPPRQTSALVAPPAPAPRPSSEQRPTFDREYLGYLGPDRLRVAVFRRNNKIEVATTGDVLDDTFVVRSITPAAVEIGFTAHPDDTEQVPLATD